MSNFTTIVTTFVPETNTLPTRVKATSTWGVMTANYHFANTIEVPVEIKSSFWNIEPYYNVAVQLIAAYKGPDRIELIGASEHPGHTGFIFICTKTKID